MGVVIFPKLGNKDGFGFSPERGNILQLEAGYEQSSEPGESLQGKVLERNGFDVI